MEKTMTKYMRNKIKELSETNRLNSTVYKHAVNMEQEFGKKCKKVWKFVNKYGEKYIFGKYVDSKNKNICTIVTIVTIGYYSLACGRYIYI